MTLTIRDVIRTARNWLRLEEGHPYLVTSEESILPDVPEYVDYYEYIKSPQWRAIAAAKKAEVGWKCEIGGQYHDNRRLEVHHTSYKHLGHEQGHFDELVVLCRRCHSEMHGLV